MVVLLKLQLVTAERRKRAGSTCHNAKEYKMLRWKSGVASLRTEFCGDGWLSSCSRAQAEDERGGKNEGNNTRTQGAQTAQQQNLPKNSFREKGQTEVEA